MNVMVKESAMVCPVEDTPRHTLWLSRLDMIARMPYSHTRIVYIYSPIDVNNATNNGLKHFDEDNNATNNGLKFFDKDNATNNGLKFFDTQTLKNSLSKVLVPFYPVAGRLKRNDSNNRIEIDCNAAGALFEEVETTYALYEFEDYRKPNNEFRKLVLPICDYSRGLSSFPLLIVRVTRFRCGGVCIAFASHHHVADGMGHSFFFNSWARLTRGLELQVQPFHDRVKVLSPRDPLQVKFQHSEYEPFLSPIRSPNEEESTIMECIFKLSKDQVDALKLQAKAEEVATYTFTTYEVLAAHIWRSTCKARGLRGNNNNNDHNQCVKLYIPTDGRSRLKDVDLPKGYFGNLTFFTSCIAKASEITCKPLWYAASKIHVALSNAKDVEYLRSSIDFLESQDEDDVTNFVRGAHSTRSPNLSINSWGRIPLHEANFGWGNPIFVGHGGIRNAGQSFLLNNGDGTTSLNISLLSCHMPLFEKYFYEDLIFPLDT